MKVLILKPRLDLPFKKFSAAVSNTNLPDLRTYWEKFIKSLTKEHQDKGDIVFVVEAPRWQFSNELVKQYQADVVYVPHTEEDRFRGGDTCLYYMQSVFPELFTIDSQGWGGGAAFNAFAPPIGQWVFRSQQQQQSAAVTIDDSIFESYKDRIYNNQSKFAQPDGDADIGYDDFIFVPLQLPHDETIKYHSDITVPEFVESLCLWSSISNVPIVFKGHPANIQSMEPLVDIIGRYSNAQSNTKYVTDVSIHKLIEASSAVYLINSGVGMEAMLHSKPIVSFGRSEYQSFVYNSNLNDLESAWKYVQNTTTKGLTNDYRFFFSWYVNKISHHCDKIDYLRLPIPSNGAI
jgi:hypothetical protein